jgi:hypothetical protein
MALELLAVLATAACVEDPLPPVDALVSRAALEHHVRYLASDELAGRETGSPELARAATYLARALERAGLRGGGDGGSFLQAVPLERLSYESAPEIEFGTPAGASVRGLYGTDFSWSVRGSPESTRELPLTSVRSASDLPDAPDPARALLLLGEKRAQREWFRSKDLRDGRAFGLEVVVEGAGESGPPARVNDGPLRLRGASTDPAREGCERVTLRGELARRAAAGEFATIRLLSHALPRALDDANVIAVLSADPASTLARETIVVSAHIDHEGLREDLPEAQDRVMNGADDDASGVAVVLELAEALAAGPLPQRTIVFLLATGEEKGLLGTTWYLEHPTRALSDTICNLNFEMLGRPDALAGGAGMLWLTGDEKTNLGAAWRARDLAIVPDPRPDQHFYERSDNIAFVRRARIVGQTLSSYNMHADYHTVDDEADRIDYAHMESAARVALEALRLLADGSLTPAWAPDPEPAAAGEGEQR